MAVESSAHLPPQVYTVMFGLSSPKYGILQGVKVKKPAVNRERFVVLGKYLDDALTLANMTQSELARRAGLRSSSYLSRVMKGERDVDRPTLRSWCAILNCPGWLEERILNAAGFASEQQRKAVETEEILEETHKTVLEEVAKRRNSDQ